MVDYTPEQTAQGVDRIRRALGFDKPVQCRFLDLPPVRQQVIEIDSLSQYKNDLAKCTRAATIKPRPALQGLYTAFLVHYTIGGRLRNQLPSLNAHSMCTAHYALGTWFTYSVDGNIIAKRCTRPTRKQYRKDISRAYAMRKAKEVQC